MWSLPWLFFFFFLDSQPVAPRSLSRCHISSLSPRGATSRGKAKEPDVDSWEADSTETHGPTCWFGEGVWTRYCLYIWDGVHSRLPPSPGSTEMLCVCAEEVSRGNGGRRRCKTEAFWTRSGCIYSCFMYESKYILAVSQTRVAVNREYWHLSGRHLICTQRETLHPVEEWGI